ncbi:hypothetical protein LRS10_23860 [Phenylobacterium sp. J426]|uniref:hypothetical protein n=1 Tax=Phenylobacterium sp. J426 TaxID=2898439 RepID=UPI002151F88C|nr:hypothetical protein [Phenylobacterium sp. J426]MCR5876922.1 hypothetical protein [Phenylobacterium sp. J426]
MGFEKQMQHHHFAAFAILAIAAPAGADTGGAAGGRGSATSSTRSRRPEQREVRVGAALHPRTPPSSQSGRYEGPIGQYLNHHLGPELAAFDSFEIKNRKVDIQVLGEVAWAREEHGYVIRAKGRQGVIERRG